jgi:hypothetical protein
MMFAQVLDEQWLRHMAIEPDDLALTPPIVPTKTKWNEEIERDVTRMQMAHPQLQNVLAAYCKCHPCDGYIQGMNFLANVFLHRLGPQGAFWALAKYMGVYRHVMPAIDKDGFFEFAKEWNKNYLTFTDGKRAADEEHVMALKWGIYSLACHNTPLHDIMTLWDSMLKLPWRLWPSYTAAVAAAAVERRIRETGEEYDARVMYTQLNFANAQQLSRRAMRIIKHRYIDTEMEKYIITQN